MNKLIFLDMDGVIVDLHSTVMARLGLTDLSAFNRGCLPHSDEELWSGTDAHWWLNLPWMADGKEIVAICEEAVGPENVVICSTPANWVGSAEGKLFWLHRNMPSYAQRFILTPNKSWCANGRTLLIDDREDNVSGFHQAGGASLLCPRPWNALNDCTAVDYLRCRIKEMLDA